MTTRGVVNKTVSQSSVFCKPNKYLRHGTISYVYKVKDVSIVYNLFSMYPKKIQHKVNLSLAACCFIGLQSRGAHLVTFHVHE
jgi:hypothetical protein